MSVGIAWATPPKPEPQAPGLLDGVDHIRRSSLAVVDRNIYAIIEREINHRTYASIAAEFGVSTTVIRQVCIDWQYTRTARWPSRGPGRTSKSFYLGYLGLCAGALCASV